MIFCYRTKIPHKEGQGRLIYKKTLKVHIIICVINNVFWLFSSHTKMHMCMEQNIKKILHELKLSLGPCMRL